MVMNFSRALTLRRIWQDESGAVATEYAFLVVFIALVGAIGMVALGENLSSFFSAIGTALEGIDCAMPDSASDQGDSNSNKCKK